MIQLAVGVVLTVVAGLLWRLAVYFLQKGLPSLNWPRANGRILMSTVDGTSDLADARISYEYFVEGQRYTGQRVSAFKGNGVAWSGMGEGISAAYPEGSEVSVAHHPERPAQSMLRPGPGLLGWT